MSTLKGTLFWSALLLCTLCTISFKDAAASTRGAGHSTRPTLTKARRAEIWDHVYNATTKSPWCDKWCDREELVRISGIHGGTTFSADELGEVMRGKKFKKGLGVDYGKVNGKWLYRFSVPDPTKPPLSSPNPASKAKVSKSSTTPKKKASSQSKAKPASTPSETKPNNMPAATPPDAKPNKGPASTPSEAKSNKRPATTPPEAKPSKKSASTPSEAKPDKPAPNPPETKRKKKSASIPSGDKPNKSPTPAGLPPPEAKRKKKSATIPSKAKLNKSPAPTPPETKPNKKLASSMPETTPKKRSASTTSKAKSQIRLGTTPPEAKPNKKTTPKGIAAERSGVKSPRPLSKNSAPKLSVSRKRTSSGAVTPSGSPVQTRQRSASSKKRRVSFGEPGAADGKKELSQDSGEGDSAEAVGSGVNAGEVKSRWCTIM